MIKKIPDFKFREGEKSGIQAVGLGETQQKLAILNIKDINKWSLLQLYSYYKNYLLLESSLIT